MTPSKNTPIWIVLLVLLIWNLGLTVSIQETWDWLFNNPIPQAQPNSPTVINLTEALRMVNESQLRGQYLSFIVETLIHHQNSLPSEQQIRNLIAVLEELQSKSVDLQYTADFISGFNSKGGGPGPSPGGGSISSINPSK